MAHRFRQHYSRDAASALLPQIRLWLDQLLIQRNRIIGLQEKMAPRLASGWDLGGPVVHGLVKALCRFQRTMAEFENREILIKDLDRGLVDFPSILGGREVYLCWAKDEEDIQFWHDLDVGYAGRERL